MRNCPENGRVCYRPICPLENFRFCIAIDRWLYQGREPVSVSLERGGRPDHGDAEKGAVGKADIFIIFSDPDIVQEYWVNGGMTKRVCDILQNGYAVWRRKMNSDGF
jgi:hypothetical protein